MFDRDLIARGLRGLRKGLRKAWSEMKESVFWVSGTILVIALFDFVKSLLRH
jgi:hypothetical protein